MSTTHETELALIDSGATEKFIDPKAVTRLRLPTKPLPKPRTVFNIDGMLNQGGSITHKTSLYIKYGIIHRLVDFYITNLGNDRAVLGFPQ